MSEMKPPVFETVRLDSIVYDEELQVRNELDREAVEAYASEYLSGNDLPPLKLARAKGVLVLVDGWHRVEALKSLSRDTARAEIVECDDRKEMHWIAAESNLREGLPLNGSEIRNVFRVYMRAKKYRDHAGRLKSFRHMAKELGNLRAYTTIRKWIGQDFPRLAPQFSGGDGKNVGPLKAAEGTDRFEVMADEALISVLAAFRGVKDPGIRGKLIRRAEEMVRIMKSAVEHQSVRQDS